MSDAIAVLNAGSSSIKFALFVDRDGQLDLDVGGQIEGLYTAPRFVARNHSGQVEAEESWEDAATFGHDGALDYLVPFLRRRLADDHLEVFLISRLGRIECDTSLCRVYGTGRIVC